MAGKKDRKKPSVVKLVIKTVLAVFTALFLVLLSLEALSEFTDNIVDMEDDIASNIDFCNWRYYDRNYAALREELTLYNLYSEDFDKYWEIVDGYEIYLRCLEYRELPDGAEQALEYQQMLERMAADCRFDENRRQLQHYIDALAENEAG